MNEKQALAAFSAMAQETRLRIVRMLVESGPEGLPAGAISEAVGATSSGASFHLAQLERAGLIQSHRESRSIIYSASFDGLANLIAFLMQDCCSGRAEVCGPAANVAATCLASSQGAGCDC
ncbi:MAG: winged helix-turn-helix transcriptional regulator [Devosia sp.]|uniref:ArsR/SmtB family transcription factor n=1 Tax=Devosia sp. TaxID=1871048 RepID=UPI0024C62B4A|nr:metalloregulator ArsR/SmtB family transcription factor [Devosia sp.]UYN99808.1 MAG: winged helix-turn-helix transcriptional regulator [Devosia sp.]